MSPVHIPQFPSSEQRPLQPFPQLLTITYINRQHRKRFDFLKLSINIITTNITGTDNSGEAFVSFVSLVHIPQFAGSKQRSLHPFPLSLTITCIHQRHWKRFTTTSTGTGIAGGEFGSSCMSSQDLFLDRSLTNRIILR